MKQLIIHASYFPQHLAYHRNLGRCTHEYRHILLPMVAENGADDGGLLASLKTSQTLDAIPNPIYIIRVPVIFFMMYSNVIYHFRRPNHRFVVHDTCNGGRDAMACTRRHFSGTAAFNLFSRTLAPSNFYNLTLIASHPITLLSTPQCTFSSLLGRL